MNRLKLLLSATSGVGITVAAAAGLNTSQSNLGLLETKPDHHHTQYPKEWPTIPAAYMLKKVVVVHRHGDRTPVCARIGDKYFHTNYLSFWQERIPSAETSEKLNQFNPWVNPDRIKKWGGRNKEESKKKDTLHGVLTQRGVEQMEAVGAALRNRYVDEYKFLPAVLDPADILGARCTPIYRCHMSLASLLTGLYPNENRTADKPAIVITSRDSTTETMWGGHTCEMAMTMSTDSSTEFLEENKAGLEKTQKAVEDAFGIDVTKDIEEGNIFTSSRHSWLFIGEVLTCFKAYGYQPFELPDWVMPKVGEIRDQVFFHKHRTQPTLNPLVSGRLLAEITKYLASAEIVGAGKIAFFSGHDTTLIPLLFSLGIADDEFKWPLYSASLVFELYEKSPTHANKENAGANLDECYIRVIYNGEEVCIANKPAMLPWSDFEDYIDANAKTGWEWSNACQQPKK